MPECLVVIAAEVPVSGRMKTRLISDGLSPKAANQLAEAFLDDTVTLAHHSALRADCWLAYAGDPDKLPSVTIGVWRIPQRGNDEGERLVHIFEEGFSAGFRSVCVIGAVMPHLPTAFVQEAFGRLAFGADAVFGMTEAGGYYLIGLRERHPELFTDIAWGTDAARRGLLTGAEKQGRIVALLPTGYGLDTLQDVQRLKRDLTRGVAYAPVTASALGAGMP